MAHKPLSLDEQYVNCYEGLRSLGAMKSRSLEEMRTFFLPVGVILRLLHRLLGWLKSEVHIRWPSRRSRSGWANLAGRAIVYIDESTRPPLREPVGLRAHQQLDYRTERSGR